MSQPTSWTGLDWTQGHLASECTAILAFCLVFALGFRICIAFTPRNVEEPQTLAAIFLWVPIVMAMVWFAVQATIELGSDVDSRWLGVSDSAWWFMRIYIASNIVAIGLEILGWWTYDRSKNIPFSGRYPILAHHALSIIAYANCLLFTRRMSFFACLDGCCEITTFFLGNLQMSKVKGGTFAQELQRAFPKLLILNGMCLWLSFLVFRCYGTVLLLSEFATSGQRTFPLLCACPVRSQKVSSLHSIQNSNEIFRFPLRAAVLFK